MRLSLLRLCQQPLAKFADRRSYVVENICGEIEDRTKRLFAVIFVHNKQFKVSQDDIIHLEHNFAADVGDRIKFDKVLMVGGENFSVVGRPLLNAAFASVHGTVIEKNYTSPDVKYNHITQDTSHPLWGSKELTALRINNITLDKGVFSE